MKNRHLPFCLILFLFGTFTLNAQWEFIETNNPTYVNHSASGLNNGTSWANAFTSLQDALALAQDGDVIWVAEGAYLPAGPGGDPTATFLINKNLKLYGGFAGTEAALSERGDPADHPTILSGDLNGDDVEDDFVAGRGDNTMTVVTANDLVQVVIDGFTISHGHADSEEPNETGRGGGLHSKLNGQGSVVVRNCLFTQNFAGRQGGGMFAQNWEAGEEEPFVIENSSFQTNSSSGNGGGIYFSQWADNSTIVVKNCQFEGNKVQSFGGGFGYFSSASSINSFLEVDGCTFLQNATNILSGSGLWTNLSGTGSNILLKNSTFAENECAGYGTASIWTYEASTADVTVEDCVFEGNLGVYDSGLNIGSAPDTGPANFMVRNCKMLGNQSETIGGGLVLWGDYNSNTSFTVEDCQIIGNSAGERIGGVWILTSSSNFNAKLDRCQILDNQSPWGSAIGAYQFDLFQFAFPEGAVFSLENSLLSGNIGSSAIALEDMPGFQMSNVTIADNDASAILLGDESGMSLQNSILANPGHEEYYAAFDATFTSNGGNLVLDNSLNGLLTAQDKPETAPDFLPGTYEPSSTSPLVNGGVNDGVASPFDLAGNERIQHGTVDIGAYESPYLTAAREAIAGQVEIFPNPANTSLNIQFPEAAVRPFEVSFFDAQSRLTRHQHISTGQSIDVENLTPGMYWVKAVVGEQVYVGKFSKQ